MTLHVAKIACLLLVGITPSAMAANDDPDVTRFFSASDLPELSREGVTLPDGHEIWVHVWDPGVRDWGLSSDGRTVTLKSTAVKSTPNAAGRRVGSFHVRGAEKVIVVVDGCDFKPASVEGDYRSGRQKIERPESTPAPPLIVLTSSPTFILESPDRSAWPMPGTNPVADARRTHVRTNNEGAGFQAPASRQEWEDRARNLRERLAVTLGLWPAPKRAPLNAQVFGKIERDRYTIERVVIETLPGFTLCGNLYRPKEATGKLPGLLCPHGHWSDGRVNPVVQSRCIHWAELGCVVFMYDMVGYNDSKDFGHEFLNDRLRRWGFSLAGLQTWNSMRALDFLLELADVDSSRIGCTGESGGGTQTFLLCALDDRVRVAAPVVMVSETFQGGCVCENAAGLRHGTDNVEIAALTAPRPMKLVGATGDWTAHTITKIHPPIRDVYRLVGQPDRIEADLFNFPHNYNETSRNAVYEFMGWWLLGRQDRQALHEGKLTPEKPEDLWSFGKDHSPSSTPKTPAQLENELIQSLASQLDVLGSATDGAQWQSARAFIRIALSTRVGLINPPLADLSARRLKTQSTHGITFETWVVNRNSAGESVPVVVVRPASPSGRATVIFHDRGKIGLMDQRTTSLSPAVAALLQRGQTVVGFDPLYVGDSFDPSAPASRRPDTAHYLTYNKSLAADRMQDLATVIAWTRSLDEIREVNLLSAGKAGPLALLARPLLNGVARTAIDLQGFDYGDGSTAVPESLDLPGVLQFGGLRAAAALSAPHPLWIARPGADSIETWALKAYQAAGSAECFRVDRDEVDATTLARWIDSGIVD